MPRADHDLAAPPELVFPSRVGRAAPFTARRPFTERPLLVRAKVRQRVKRAIDIEHPDRDLADCDDAVRIGRKLINRPDFIGSHQETAAATFAGTSIGSLNSSIAFSPRMRRFVPSSMGRFLIARG